MVFGFLGLVVSQIILISAPERGYIFLLAATILEGASIPATATLLDKLIVVSVDAQERARIMSILYVLVIVLTSPFGWIAGQLSEVNRGLPFALNIILYTIGGLLACRASHSDPERYPIGKSRDSSMS